MPTKEEIISWWSDPVADMFKEMCTRNIIDSVVEVREAIKTQNMGEALSWNARADVFEEVRELKDEMIEELGGE